MFIPINLHYTKHHLWLRQMGRSDLYIGITDYAQKEAGRIESLEIDREGTKKKKGEVFGKVYGTNKTFELIMPFNGQLLMVNTEGEADPRTLNSDTYHFWIALISSAQSTLSAHSFLSAVEYRLFIRH